MMQDDNRAGLLLIVASCVPLAVAFLAQYGAGLQPCELCIYERWFYVGSAFFGVVALWGGLRRAAVMVAIILLLASVGLSGFHVGVEEGWWGETLSCSSIVKTPETLDALRASLSQAPIVPCDRPPWRLFGVSMAGYNGLYAVLLAVVLWAIFPEPAYMSRSRRFTRRR